MHKLFKKKYPLGQTEFAKQLKQAIPFLMKVKVGYLEKFISGLSRGGTLISIIFIGGADTAKWYFDEKSQNVQIRTHLIPHTHKHRYYVANAQDFHSKIS